MNIDGLLGFGSLKEFKPKWGYFHDSCKWGENIVFGRLGACWRMYTIEGFPLTRSSHSLEIDNWGHTIISKLGSSKVEYDFDDLQSTANGLRNMIKQMIEENQLEGYT